MACLGCKPQTLQVQCSLQVQLHFNVLIPLLTKCLICQVSLSFERFSFNYLNIIPSLATKLLFTSKLAVLYGLQFFLHHCFQMLLMLIV